MFHITPSKHGFDTTLPCSRSWISLNDFEDIVPLLNRLSHNRTLSASAAITSVRVLKSILAIGITMPLKYYDYGMIIPREAYQQKCETKLTYHTSTANSTSLFNPFIPLSRRCIQCPPPNKHFFPARTAMKAITNTASSKHYLARLAEGYTVSRCKE